MNNFLEIVEYIRKFENTMEYSRKLRPLSLLHNKTGTEVTFFFFRIFQWSQSSFKFV